jgi:exopolyphosphatase/pppGpp-phosphohydrolase
MPNVLNAIDTEGVIEDLALAAEVSRLRLRTRAEREALAKQQQDAQAQQLQMQQLQGMGGAARALRDVAAARADMPELANLMS